MAGAFSYKGTMRIVVDTREQRPWTFEGQGLDVVRAKLDAGDYSVEGLTSRVAIERKSADDFIGTVLRDRTRFYRELERLRAYDFRAVVVEVGIRELMAGEYKSRMDPRAAFGFVSEIYVRQSVPVYLAGSRAEAQILSGALLRECSRRFAATAEAQ